MGEQSSRTPASTRPIRMTKERNERFKRICQRAQELWESEGRPTDRGDAFWLAAMAEVDAGAWALHDQPAPEKVPLLSRVVEALDDTAPQLGHEFWATECDPQRGVKMHNSRL